jgi:hypothetical protein
MTTISELREDRWILVEGPSSGDAEFTSQWLQAAIEADRLLKDYYSNDPIFRSRIDRLEVVYIIEFASSAMTFVEMWLKGPNVFSLGLSEWATEFFAIMVPTGFFTRTGDRYQMTIPKDLKIETIKNSLLQFAATEDSEYDLHPESLLTTVTQQGSPRMDAEVRSHDFVAAGC